MSEIHGMRVYTSGDLTIVTFEERGYLASQTIFGAAGEHLERIVEQSRCKVLILDLAEITALPSLMLGVLVAIQHRGVEIRLFNITDDVRVILETTNLDQVFEIREGDLQPLINDATEV